MFKANIKEPSVKKNQIIEDHGVHAADHKTQHTVKVLYCIPYSAKDLQFNSSEQNNTEQKMEEDKT